MDSRPGGLGGLTHIPGEEMALMKDSHVSSPIHTLLLGSLFEREKWYSSTELRRYLARSLRNLRRGGFPGLAHEPTVVFYSQFKVIILQLMACLR